MANYLESTEALEILNQALGKDAISPQQFSTIYTLMAENGDALTPKRAQRGCTTSDDFWKWKLYILTRRNLIAAGEWTSNRPYSIADMEDISILGMYESYQPESPAQII